MTQSRRSLAFVRFTALTAFAAFTIAVVIAKSSDAAVSFVGSVNPDPPANGGTFATNTTLAVGDGNDPNSNDIRAWLRIDDGTLLQYGRLVVGDEEDYFGEVHVVGDFLAGKNTQFNFSTSGSFSNPSVQIGRDGIGRLTVSGGATMTTTNSSGNMSIGLNPSGIGHTRITDPFTILTVDDNIYIGQRGIGTLEVLNGALARTLDSSSSRYIGIGVNTLGIGTVIVDGPGSMLRSASSLVVSGNSVSAPTEFGQGTLKIRNGGIVDVDNTSSARIQIGPLGRIELSEGTLIGFTPAVGFGTTIRGYLGGAGLVRGSVEIERQGFVEANPGQLLRFSGAVENQGSITIDNGESWFLGPMLNRAPGAGIPPGRISLENATIRFSQVLENNGVISSAAGSNNIHGEIINNERVIVARDTVATFYDFFDPSIGMVDVLPGGNAIFLADLGFQSASVLQLGIGAASLTDTASPISAGGVISLAGSLNINLDNNYTPSLGQTYELLKADGGIVGAFDSTNLPSLPGDLEFGLLYTSNSVLMEVRAEQLAVGLPGDYNNDGVVDAADYTVWRYRLGQTFTLTNEHPQAATPGIVDQEDYTFWKANYGTTLLGSGGLAGGLPNASIPEPSTLLISALAIASIVLLRRSK